MIRGDIMVWISGLSAGLLYGTVRNGQSGVNRLVVNSVDNEYVCSYKNKTYISKTKPFINKGMFYDTAYISERGIEYPFTNINSIKPLHIV